MDCIICLENNTKKKFVHSPSFEALEKLLKRSRERASYKDNIVTSFVERTTDNTAKELYESKVCYHESCYSNLVNVGKLVCAKKRYADSINSGESSVIKRKAARPSLNILKEPAVEPLTTMSNSKLYDRSCCIICQNSDEKDDLTRVEFKSTGERMLKVSARLQDKSFFRRLNSITNAKDAVANEVVYHNPCWVKAKRGSAYSMSY